MSQIQLHKIIIPLLLSLVFMKEVTPIDINSKEILEIYNKDRDYYNLFQDTVIYIIEGPCMLDVYSRLAFPELIKKIKPYKFSVVIIGEDFRDSLVVDHHFRKDLNVLSLEHPKYSYTLSGKDIINIPAGKHQIELVPLDSKAKILVRLISKPFKKKRGMSSIDISKKADKKILKNHKDENSQYFSLVAKDTKNKLFFNVEGPGFVEISSRIASPQKDGREYYQFKIRENGELNGTYHMFAQKSNNWGLILPDNVSGSSVSVKRRSYFKVPKGSYNYELELIYPYEKNVFFRLSQEK